MKSVLLPLALGLVLVSSARGADGLPPLPPPNQPPKVEIVLPSNGATFAAPAAIAIAANASDPDDRVRTVEFFANRESIGIRTNIPSLNPTGENPFRLVWNVTTPGAYALTAVARDITGAEAVSSAVNISVVESRLTTVQVVASVPETREQDPASPAVFKVVRTGSLNHRLNVHFKLEGTARNGGDYKQVPEMVVIPVGESAAAIAIHPIPDATREGNETVTLTLEQRFYLVPPPIEDSYLVVEPRSASVVIRETTTPGGFPPKVDILQPVAGATFPAGQDVPVKVDAVDADGYISRAQLFADGKVIGTENRSYLVKPPPGEIAHFSFVWQGAPSGTHELVARAMDDTGLETASIPVKITVGDGTGTLPVVTVVAPDASASESDPADTAYFKILRTGSQTGKLVVHYLVEGTAGNGTDYEKLSGIATIPAGEGSAALVIKPVPDKAIEGRETVVIRVVKPLSTNPPTPEERYTIGDPSSATAVITESGNTGLPPKVAIVSPASGSTFPERSDITVQIDAVDADGYITLAELYAGERLVASEPRIYIVPPPAGQLAQFKLTWKGAPAGEHVLTAKARDNSGLTSASPAIKIIVKPASDLPVVTVVTSDAEAHENDPKNTAVFKVVRTGRTAGKLVVRYSTSGAASNGTDYEKLPGTVAFADGQESAPVVITALPDQRVEGRESVTIRIEPPSSTRPAAEENYLVGSPRSASAVILDGTVPNASPKVALVAPKNLAQFSAPTDVELKAEATDADGKIAEVSFYAGSKLLGTVTQAPYVFQWKSVPAGQHVILARARDDRGATTTSRPVIISVKDPLAATFVKRDLPDGYLPGSPLKVTLEAVPHSSVQTYAIEERAPKGWTVGAITEGTHDAASGKIKFGPFFDNKARTLVYEVVPPAGDSGRKEFTGTASANGRSSSVGGDRVIEAARLRHPADTGRPEFTLHLDELTAYGQAWKSGQKWPEGPNPIPQNYVTRAALIWQQGEGYLYDPKNGDAPLCWVPKPVTPTTVARAESRGDQASALPAFGLPSQSKALRHRVNGGNSTSTRVVITVAPRRGVEAFTLEERIPTGWKVADVSDEGVFDPVTRTIRWGVFLDDRTRTVSYQVSAPALADEARGLDGTASFDGTNVRVTENGGPKDSTGAPGRLRMLQRRNDGAIEMTFSGEPGVRYAVQVSTDLISWRPLQEIDCASDSFDAVDPQADPAGPRYYRAVPQN